MMESAKQLEERLLYTREYAMQDEQTNEKAHVFREDYKQFLNQGKTEREVAKVCEERLLAAGYKAFEPGRRYQPGEKIYLLHREKCVIAATIGSVDMERGFRLNAAHIDSPRLDLRPMPLFENGGMAFFRTHYYGGIRKYQWGTIPLAIHGVAYLENGRQVVINVGEEEGDPVFCITDLLPHLSAKQNERKLPDGIKGEELNILIGSEPIPDPEAKKRVKLNTMLLLNEKYGITEKDLVRAEIEIVPAHKARDVGFDRAMVGAYGQDDRVDAYGALMAEIRVQDPIL